MIWNDSCLFLLFISFEAIITRCRRRRRVSHTLQRFSHFLFVSMLLSISIHLFLVFLSFIHSFIHRTCSRYLYCKYSYVSFYMCVSVLFRLPSFVNQIYTKWYDKKERNTHSWEWLSSLFGGEPGHLHFSSVWLCYFVLLVRYCRYIHLWMHFIPYVSFISDCFFVLFVCLVGLLI